MKHILNFLQIISGALLALNAVSCADEPYNGLIAPTESEGALVIPYEVDGQMPLARGVATTSYETKLSHAYVMFFDPEDSNLFVGYSSVTVPAGKKTLSFDPPKNLSEGHEYRILALGNADSYCSTGNYGAEFISTFEGSYNDAVGKLQVAYQKPVTSATPGKLPLWGEFVDSEDSPATFSFTKDDEGKLSIPKNCRFYFSRSICRIDIHNLVGGILKIHSARIVNARDASLAFEDGLNVGKIIPYSPVQAPDGEGYMPVTEDIQPGVNTTQRLDASLYAFPNIVSNSVVNDTQTTSIMIAGYYKNESGTGYEDKLTYYRFNLANLGESQVMKRNYCYKATIKGVRRRGSEDEKTAFNDSSPIFDYNVDEEWNTSDDNVATDKDGNFLIVNRTHLTFPGDASTSDFVELRVSTNPELKWEVEWLDSDGNSNDKFTFEKLSDQAVKCGPTEINDSKYVRYGYLRIVATNPSTGKKLYMPIYLMQLSIHGNVKMLTVNDNTGSFAQELDPMGGTIRLKVVTGGAQFSWSCEDYGNSLSNWDTQGVKFTKSGGNGTTLEITVPANFTVDERTARLIVSLDEDPEGKVQPVTILLNQKRSSQLMDVINFPSSGQLDIECLDLTPNQNNNGVVNPKNFIVRLASTEYRYRVISEFDKNRDLVLSAGNNRDIYSDNPAYATHPADGSVVTDMLEDMQNEQQFWINPFRTGPGDPIISGTITIEAYHPTDTDMPTERRSFTVNLLSRTVEVNDVILKNGEDYLLVADRNLGVNCRTQNDGETYQSQYYSSLPGFKITNRANATEIWVGDYITNSYTFVSGTYGRLDNYTTPTNALVRSIEKFISMNKGNGYFYSNQDGWCFPSVEQFNYIAQRICYSKQRAFLVSDISVKRKGKEIPTVCWLPYYESNCALYGGSKSYYSLNKYCSYANWTTIMPYAYISKGDTKSEAKEQEYSNGNGYNWAWKSQVRLIYPITTDEQKAMLEQYKKDVLGY